MVQFGDNTYDEERAVEKLFRCIPEKYNQIARSIESLLDLLDLSTMSIEYAICHLKVIDGDEPQPLSGPITDGGKLLFTRKQWEAYQVDEKKGESSPSTGGARRARRAEVPTTAPPATKSQHEMTRATTVASLAIGPRSVDIHDAARLTSHRWRSRLCSWHTQASSYL
jgi:hypothetical protein